MERTKIRDRRENAEVCIRAHNPVHKEQRARCREQRAENREQKEMKRAEVSEEKGKEEQQRLGRMRDKIEREGAN
jgi:hypothetical protein